MILNLPYPPSANTIWRHVTIHGRPRTLLSAKGREYRKAIADLLPVDWTAAPHYKAQLAVQIKAHAPDRRRRDLDNVCKATLDALTHAGLWADDSQICDLHIVRGEPVPGGRLTVTVEAMT